MKHLSDFLSKAFAFILVLFVLSLIIASDSCTRVHRSSIPVMYTFRFVDFLTQNWTSDDTKIMLLKAQIDSALFLERFFEKTFTDVKTDERGDTIYRCNPVSKNN